MKNLKISFSDHVYLEALTMFGENEKKMLVNLSKSNGVRRFEAALTDTYASICIKDDGQLSDEGIRQKFISHLRKRLKYYSSQRTTKALSDTTISVANKFNGMHTPEINDLLQCGLILFKQKDYGDKKIVSEFKKIKDLAEQTNSYQTWFEKTKTLIA